MDYDQNWEVTIYIKVLYFFIYLNVLSEFRVTATTATTVTTVTSTAAAVNQLMLFDEWMMRWI